MEFWDVVESPFMFFGLNTGLKRFAFVSLATGFVLWHFQPAAFFDQTGKPYPWTLTSKDDYALPLDWMGFSLIMGASAALFI
jgi:hypothetical protein